MKPLGHRIALSFLILSSAAVTALGQGQLAFNSNPTVPILILDSAGLRVPDIGSILVGLYVSSDTSATADSLSFVPNSITPVGPMGVFLGGIKTVHFIPGNTYVVAEIRAWSAGYDSYEQAVASASPNNTIYAGRSGILPNTIRLMHNVPPNITTAGGYTGMTLSPVPEPSSWALGIIGGLGILWSARRGSPLKTA